MSELESMFPFYPAFEEEQTLLAVSLATFLNLMATTLLNQVICLQWPVSLPGAQILISPQLGYTN